MYGNEMFLSDYEQRQTCVSVLLCWTAVWESRHQLSSYVFVKFLGLSFISGIIV